MTSLHTTPLKTANFFSDLFEEGKGLEELRARVSQDLVEEGKG
jgi:hypothetical protein